MNIGLLTRGGPGSYPVSAHVRLLQPARFASKRGKSFVHIQRRKIREVLGLLDLVVLGRDAVQNGQEMALLSQLSQMEIPLVVDLDDLIVNSVEWRSAGSAEINLGLDTLCRNAVGLTVSTETLKSFLSSLSTSVHVVPNFLADDLWFEGPEGFPGQARIYEALSRSRNSGLRMLLVSQQSHDAGVRLLAEAVTELQRDGLDIEVYAIGEGFEDTGFRTLTVPRQTREYPHFVRWLRGLAPLFDVGVSPYASNAFNNCKSNLKFLDYSALGLPGLFTEIDPYLEQAGAFSPWPLVEHSIESWKVGILNAYRDREKLVDFGAEVKDHVFSKYRLSSNIDAWIGSLDMLTEGSAHKVVS